MDYIARLKLRVKDCQYGEAEESMLCDMAVNGLKDTHCVERLMDLEDDELTLANVTKICRQSELTRTPPKKLTKTEAVINQVSYGRRRGRGCG